MHEQVVSILVYSGRPQPPAQTSPVRVDTAVIVRVTGLGPARAFVFAPDGSRVVTSDGPLMGDGGVMGTEHRFTPHLRGVYRIEHAEVSGLLLASVDAS